MITFYGDEVAEDLTVPHISNRYLNLHVENPEDENQHFTGHPQLDFSVFKYITSEVSFKTFNDYTPGQNVVPVGLHGGWTKKKLKLIKQWFMQSDVRKQAWYDPKCLIIIDYSEEGFTTEVFEDVWHWIENNNLQDRVLYVSSSSNVTGLYKEWSYLTRHYENMRTAWYGFFPNWLLKDHGSHTLVSRPAQWTEGTQRYMCLNRRPYPHRILLTTLLEHFKIVGLGAVSMPRQFAEKEIKWKPEDFDTLYQWELLKERVNGHFDNLEPAFQSLYAKLPLIADTDNFSTNYALNLNDDFYQHYPINVVSETLFFSAATFHSEKIWKPMLMEQIFFVMAAPFYLQSLRDLGFKTFSPFINEDYDTMLDPVERSVALVQSLKSVLKLTDTEFKELLDNCRHILDHNKIVLMDKDKLEHVINHNVAQAIESTWDYLSL